MCLLWSVRKVYSIHHVFYIAKHAIWTLKSICSHPWYPSSCGLANAYALKTITSLLSETSNLHRLGKVSFMHKRVEKWVPSLMPEGLEKWKKFWFVAPSAAHLRNTTVITPKIGLLERNVVHFSDVCSLLTWGPKELFDTERVLLISLHTLSPVSVLWSFHTVTYGDKNTYIYIYETDNHTVHPCPNQTWLPV